MKTITATTMCFNACFRSGHRVKWNLRWKAVSFRRMQIHRIKLHQSQKRPLEKLVDWAPKIQKNDTTSIATPSP